MRNGKAVDIGSARPPIAVPDRLLSVLADSRRDTEEREAGRETSFGNPNLSAFAILSARLEADLQGKQLNRGAGFLNQ